MWNQYDYCNRYRESEARCGCRAGYTNPMFRFCDYTNQYHQSERASRNHIWLDQRQYRKRNRTAFGFRKQHQRHLVDHIECGSTGDFYNNCHQCRVSFNSDNQPGHRKSGSDYERYAIDSKCLYRFANDTDCVYEYKWSVRNDIQLDAHKHNRSYRNTRQ